MVQKSLFVTTIKIIILIIILTQVKTRKVSNTFLTITKSNYNSNDHAEEKVENVTISNKTFQAGSCTGNVAILSDISYKSEKNFSAPEPYDLVCYECDDKCTLINGDQDSNIVQIGCNHPDGCVLKVYLNSNKEKRQCSNISFDDVIPMKIQYENKAVYKETARQIVCYECSDICGVYNGEFSSSKIKLVCYTYDGCEAKIYVAKTSNDANYIFISVLLLLILVIII